MDSKRRPEGERLPLQILQLKIQYCVGPDRQVDQVNVGHLEVISGIRHSGTPGIPLKFIKEGRRCDEKVKEDTKG
jgi:hypothetical protein